MAKDKDKKDTVVEAVLPPIKNVKSTQQKLRESMLAENWWAIVKAKSQVEINGLFSKFMSAYDMETGDWLFSIEEIDNLVTLARNSNCVDMERLVEIRSVVNGFSN